MQQEDLQTIRDRIMRMAERITNSVLPYVDRDTPLLTDGLSLPMLDNVHVLQRSLREFQEQAKSAEHHGLGCMLHISYNCNLFFNSRKIYTNKGWLSF